ncbi:MAG: synthase sector subunit b' [Deltaproteobacteria bacterium]|nr:synthase sector subunit b' [Deltaproteobacteria bacterium]
MLTFPPDSSFLIQIALFYLLWLGLKRLLFDPVMRVLEAREARTTGMLRDATELKAGAEHSAAEYDRRMRDVYRQLAADAERARGAAETEERQLIGSVREQASTQLQQARESLGRQAAAARALLATEAQDLSARMIERVTGRPL